MKHSVISAEEIAQRKFGKLQIKIAQDISPRSDKKIEWLCDCGRGTTTHIKCVLSGHTKSCGHCHAVSSEEMAQKKFGKLRIKIPQSVNFGSAKKITWICDCGRETITPVNRVISGKTESCGRCSVIPLSEMIEKKFGKLRIKIPKDVFPGSARKIEWICDCGQEAIKQIDLVVSGKTRSCGNCRQVIQNWYLDNKNEIGSLQCPMEPSNFTTGGMIPLETILSSAHPFKATCSACGYIYYPRLGDIKLGKSLTCGCSYDKISLAQRQIAEFIESLGIEAVLEHQINTHIYDIFVPSKNLLIEYNGLKWHSMLGSKQRDITKYQNAILNKFDYLMIFEDEWVFNKQKVESLLRNKLSVIKSTSLRPSECEIKLIPSNKSDPFYSQFHYIGPVKARINYGVFFGNKLIACSSFKKPTRQSHHSYELVRMASDPEYRIHGIWSKILKKFIADTQPKSIVSFSDNRLFDGKVYEKIGFRFDGDIASDYYWVKGKRRFHKSALRKTSSEKLTGLTETQLREDQGYQKIWDIGKKRWVFECQTNDS
jgi:hypothetical protein